MFDKLKEIYWGNIIEDKLTDFQLNKYNDFWKVINHKENLFFNAKDRAVGKSYLLNEIGFELQILGYRVFLITPCNQEYFAERMISLHKEDYKGRLQENCVVLVDEVKWLMMNDFLDYCKYRQVPIIGFVRYEDKYKPFLEELNPIKFQREYEFKWL